MTERLQALVFFQRWDGCWEVGLGITLSGIIRIALE
jgi:hypothetical protein